MSLVFLAAHTMGPLVVLAGWLGSVRWVALDARARLRNPRGGRAAVIAAALVPGFGLFVWLCVRPSETLLERRERRLWTLLLESDLRNAAGEEELRRGRRDDRARPAAREPTRLRLDPRAVGVSRPGDEADRQRSVDEAVLLELLPKRELVGLEFGEQAAAG